MSPRLGGLGLGAVVLVADQVSKYLVLHNAVLADGGFLSVLPVLNFVLVWNTGITFGLFGGMGAKIVIAAVAACVIAALLTWLWRERVWLKCLPIGAIAGGAVGNVADRLHHGAVVDFIQAHLGPYSFYVFNVGDSAIVCGVGVLMLESLLPRNTGGDRKAA